MFTLGSTRTEKMADWRTSKRDKRSSGYTKTKPKSTDCAIEERALKKGSFSFEWREGGPGGPTER